MTVKVTWSHNPKVQVFDNLNQREVNKIVSHISKMKEQSPLVTVKVEVS